MALLAFLLRAILFLFIFRLVAVIVRAFLGGFFQGARSPEPSVRTHRSPFAGGPEPKGQIEELVKDPVCGVHTARSSAIAGTFRGAAAFFCSEECAAKASSA